VEEDDGADGVPMMIDLAACAIQQILPSSTSSWCISVHQAIYRKKHEFFQLSAHLQIGNKRVVRMGANLPITNGGTPGEWHVRQGRTHLDPSSICAADPSFWYEIGQGHLREDGEEFGIPAQRAGRKNASYLLH